MLQHRTLEIEASQLGHAIARGRRGALPPTLVLVALTAAVTFGCDRSPADSEGGLPPSAKGSTAEAAPLPANFTDFADPSGLFKISYPNDWQAMADPAQLNKTLQDLFKKLDADIPLDNAKNIFGVGKPNGTGFMPNMNVIIEPLPAGTKHDRMVQMEVNGARQYIKDLKEHSRKVVTIDGRTTTILSWEGSLPGIGKTRVLQSFTMVGRNAWIVTCTPPQGEFDKHASEFDAILHSLRVLK